MDDFQFDNILKHVYELEGLVMVARRNETDAGLLIPMMQAKAAEISDLLTRTPAGNDTVPESEVPDEVQEETEMPEPDGGEEACTHTAEHGEQPREDATGTTDDEEEPAADASQEVQAPILTENDDDGGSSHDSPEEPAVEMTFDYEEPAKIITDDGDTPAGTIDDNAGNDNYAPCRTEPESDNTNDNDGNGYADETVTVDALLQRNMSRDLKKAFTINDRFRYRRELFGNSDIEMNDALNLVEAMQSYSEAEEYFYDMLNWDKQSPEVADFMSIIRNHFYSK